MLPVRPSRSSGADSGSTNESAGRADCGETTHAISRPGETPVAPPLVVPATVCLFAGATLQFSFTGTGTVTWAVNEVPGGNSYFGTIDATGLYVAPSLVPAPPNVTVTATGATVNGSATVIIKPSPRLLAVTFQGSNTLYTELHDSYGNPINITSDTYVVSQVFPNINRWIFHDYCTDQSYARCDPRLLEQDGQVFFVNITDTSCSFTSEFNPESRSLRQFRLVYPSTQGNQMAACDLSHVAIVGDSIYWKVPQTSDWWGGAPIGGEFRVESGGTSRVILSRTDGDNTATLDIADRGNLYAIFRGANTSVLAVFARDLTTGKTGNALRAYNTSSIDSLYDCCSTTVDDGIFYLVLRRKADNAIQILGTDLTQSSDPLWILYTLPDTFGYSNFDWSADNEHVTILLHFADTTRPSTVIDVDVSSGTARYYDLTGKPNVMRMVSVWR